MKISQFMNHEQGGRQGNNPLNRAIRREAAKVRYRQAKRDKAKAKA